MFEQMELLEGRVLLASNPLDAPELPIIFADVRITLLQEEAPRAVRSFLELRDQGKLKDVIVHRDSPGSRAVRTGLFRDVRDGLEFARRPKRIDGERSLPTIAGTVAFVRDPENPRRTTGEIVFNKVGRPLARGNMVVFGRFTFFRTPSVFFDLRDHADVENAERLRSVPIRAGDFEEPVFFELGMGDFSFSGRNGRLGGLASSDTAEWIAIKNRSDSVQPFEIRVSYSNPDHASVLARGTVNPRRTKLVKLHVGDNLSGVNHADFFRKADGEVLSATGLKRNRPYSLSISGFPISAVLQRIERDPEFGGLRSMRITNEGRMPESKSFGVVDLRDAGASGRIILKSGSSGRSTFVIEGTNEQNEFISVTRTVGAGRIKQVDLGEIDGLTNQIVNLRLREIDGNLSSAILIDEQADFAPMGRAKVISRARTTRFEQRRLPAGAPLTFLVFNPNNEDITIEPVVSLITCQEHRDCPDDPPGVPDLEPLTIQSNSFAWYPAQDELVFSREYIFRLDTTLGLHLAIDSRVLLEL